MKRVALSKLEGLEGAGPAAVYEFAKSIGFRVVISSEMLPTDLFYRVLYVRLSDDDTVERVWCQENQIIFDK